MSMAEDGHAVTALQMRRPDPGRRGPPSREQAWSTAGVSTCAQEVLVAGPPPQNHAFSVRGPVLTNGTSTAQAGEL